MGIIYGGKIVETDRSDLKIEDPPPSPEEIVPIFEPKNDPKKTRFDYFPTIYYAQRDL